MIAAFIAFYQIIELRFLIQRVSGSYFRKTLSRARILKHGSRRLGESRILPFYTPTSRSRAARRPSNPSVYGCVGRIQTPLIPSVVSMSHGLLSLYIFWYAASYISSYSFHDFLSFYGGCREKEAFDRRHSASLLSVLRPTALKTTPKNPDLTQIRT